MKRSVTPSFVLTLKLNTSKDDERILMKRFFYGWKIYNVLVRHVRKAIRSMRQDAKYRDAMNRYRKDRKSSGIKKELSDIREQYGLSEYALHKFVKLQQKRYAADIDSLTAQKIASHVWQAAQDVLFDSGKAVHFQKWMEFHSLEGKNNQSGIRFKDGRLRWNGLVIQPRLPKNDHYAREALKNRVKYCRISKKTVGNREQFYLQLILEGTPPVKHQIGSGRCGIDIGPSTIATVSGTDCSLKVLASEAESVERKQRILFRKMDRSRRAMNPDNYNQDGTVRKGRKHWKKSNTYRKIQRRYQNLCRKRAAIVKQSHEREANRLLTQADRFYVETMNFQGLAKRAQETKQDESGRCKRKSRFGKSIANRAPAMFLSILERKLNAQGGCLRKIDTVRFRASQYNHLADTYQKKTLSERWSLVGEDKIQRDLYSAFLLMNSNADGTSADRELCIKTYQDFKQKHDQLIERLKQSNEPLPKSFGLRKAA